MPQVCGIESLYPSDSLLPSDSLAPGSGSVFVPTLPLDPSDFPIDDSAAAFVATSQVISLSRFYAGRFFNDLPEWFQGLPLPQLPGVDPLPEYVNDPDNVEAKHWGVQRIILRSLAREMARIDYILRGRVSLADFEAKRTLPHATPADDRNVFELVIRADEPAYIEAPASFVDPATVQYSASELRTNRVPVYAEGSGAAGVLYIFAQRINDISTAEVIGASGGTFRFLLRGERTAALPPTASAASIQAQIEAFTFVEPGDIVVTDISPGKWQFEWRGGFAGTDVDELRSDDSLLVGADPFVDHVTIQDGNAGFMLVAQPTDTPASDDFRLIGDATWDGTQFLAVETLVGAVGGVDNGQAYYNPFEDPLANNDTNPACTPLSQNEGLAPQMFAVTANWALDLWEQTFGLEVPSKNPTNQIQYPERRARLLRAILGVYASTGAEYSYLAAERARELGIVIGEFEEALYTDPGWDDDDYVVQAVDEVQFLQLNNATGGTYRVSLDGVDWTTDIAWNAADVVVESTVLADLGLSPGDVEVVASGARLYFHFGGIFSGVDMPPIFTDASNLAGLVPLINSVPRTSYGDPANVPADVLVAGAGPSTNEVQRLTLANVVAGTLQAKFGLSTSRSAPYSQSPAEMDALLTSLFTIGDDDVSVTGVAGQEYTIQFTGQLASQDVDTLLFDTTALVGTPATISKGVDRVNLSVGAPGGWRGRDVVSPAYGVPYEGDPAESTYPWYLWTTVYSVDGLTEDPAGAASRIAALRDYINSMTPAHLQVGFDWGPIGGFIVDISLVGIDRV